MYPSKSLWKKEETEGKQRVRGEIPTSMYERARPTCHEIATHTSVIMQQSSRGATRERGLQITMVELAMSVTGTVAPTGPQGVYAAEA